MQSLPLELSGEIIGLAVLASSHTDTGDIGRGRYYECLYRLALVCRLWRDIILSSPSMWSWIDGTSHDWMMALARSRNTPLMVKCDEWYSSDWKVKSSLPNGYWSAVTHHTRRWRSAQIHINSIRDLSELETHEAPILHSLDVNILNSRPLNLFNGVLSHLRSVTLSNVSLKNWDSLRLRHLQHLSIAGIDSNGPSVLQILSILIATPNLRSLQLERITFGNETTALGNPSVRLEQLQRLEVLTITVSEFDSLLSAIIFPNCRSIRLCPSEPVIEPRPLLAQCIENVVSLTKSVAASVGTVLVSCYKDSVRCMVLGKDGAVFVAELQCLPVSLLLFDWIVPSLADRINGTVMVHFHSLQGLAALEIFTLLGRLQGVGALEFHGRLDGEVVEEVLRGMSSPQVVDGRRRWLCPELRSLYIFNVRPSDPLTLLRMVEERDKASRKRRKEDAGRDEPLRLDALTLAWKERAIDSDTLRGIKATVPNVYWARVQTGG